MVSGLHAAFWTAGMPKGVAHALHLPKGVAHALQLLAFKQKSNLRFRLRNLRQIAYARQIGDLGTTGRVRAGGGLTATGHIADRILTYEKL